MGAFAGYTIAGELASETSPAIVAPSGAGRGTLGVMLVVLVECTLVAREQAPMMAAAVRRRSGVRRIINP